MAFLVDIVHVVKVDASPGGYAHLRIDLAHGGEVVATSDVQVFLEAHVTAGERGVLVVEPS